MSAKIPVEEIKFQVTLGSIAAKWWGSKEKRPILMLHGWLDNAGTFDTLIPLLPSNYSYLAIDLPGHGLSSHLPPGCFYHVCDYVSILEEIRMKFKWEKLSLIGHSMGDTICFVYASLYPTQVDLVCALDNLKTVSLQKFTLFLPMKHMKAAYTMNASGYQKKQEFTYDEMKKIASKSSIDSTKVIHLLRRDMKVSKKSPNKFQFNHDIRVQYALPFNLLHEDSLYFIKQIRAPHLYIKTDDKSYDEDQQKFNETIDLFQKHCLHFEMINVNGTHHVHLNHPELISTQISDFLLKYHVDENNDIQYLSQPIVSKM